MPITLRNTIQKGLIGNEWGAPTIYIDSGKTVESNNITAIGVADYSVDNAVGMKTLPINTTVIQVGTKVKEVHYINVQDDIIPKDLFKYATNVKDLSGVFQGTDIKEIPAGLFDACRKVESFENAFRQCHSLTAIPAGLFDKCPNVTSFYFTFFGCQNLTAIPAGLFDKCPNVTNFGSTFSCCDALKAIPDGLFDNNTEADSFHKTFFCCVEITDIPDGLFDTCTKVTSFRSTFESCERLTAIPTGLFDNCPNVTDYNRAFLGCKSLRGTTPIVTAKDGNKYKLWELEGKPGYPQKIDGGECFDPDSMLNDRSDIPSDWLFKDAYSNWKFGAVKR